MSSGFWASETFFPDDLQPLGLAPDIGTGAFLKADTLLAFVEKNPDYHIISGKPGHQYNRYVPGCSWFYLSRNTADPDLEVSCPPMTPERAHYIIDDIMQKCDGNPCQQEQALMTILRILVLGESIYDHLYTRERRLAVRQEALDRKKLAS